MVLIVQCMNCVLNDKLDIESIRENTGWGQHRASLRRDWVDFLQDTLNHERHDALAEEQYWIDSRTEVFSMAKATMEKLKPMVDTAMAEHKECKWAREECHRHQEARRQDEIKRKSDQRGRDNTREKTLAIHMPEKPALEKPWQINRERASLLPLLKDPPPPPPPSRVTEVPKLIIEQEQMDNSAIPALSTEPGLLLNREAEPQVNPEDYDYDLTIPSQNPIDHWIKNILGDMSDITDGSDHNLDNAAMPESDLLTLSLSSVTSSNAKEEAKAKVTPVLEKAESSDKGAKLLSSITKEDTADMADFVNEIEMDY